MKEDREERLFELNEALERSLERGESFPDSVWAKRFDLELEEVARARLAIEFLAGSGDDLDALEELPPPSLPADYELENEIGRGGMGVVYRVHQKSLDRHLALKVLRPGEAVARRALERFKREARSLARLRHPHIASVHEVGEWDRQVYFTMDLIEGQPLSVHIAENQITPTQAVRWMRQVTSAVQYVHSHGLVHRDIKPANILIDENGDACVVDFGLAREVQTASDLTLSGHFLGTPAYMSPEQARGDQDQIGEATDIYAIGAVFYECLTGERAFSGSSIVEIIAAVCEGSPVPPRKRQPSVPEGLERICLKAMAVTPEERYVTARALLEDFERFEEGRPVQAVPPNLARQFSMFCRRHKSTLLTSLVTTLVLGGIFALFVLPLIPSGDQRLLDSALGLQQRGESDASVQLYRESYPDSATLDQLRSHGLAYAQALIAVSDESERDGDAQGAKRHLDECRTLIDDSLEQVEGLRQRLPGARDDLNALQFELMSLSVQTLMGEVDSAELDEALAEIGGDLSLRATVDRSVELPARFETFGSARGRVEALLAESCLTSLIDPQSPGNRAAVLIWAKALTGTDQREFQDWIRENLAEPEQVLVAMLRAADQLTERQARWAQPRLDRGAAQDWMRLVESCDPDRLLTALMELGEEIGDLENPAYRKFVVQLADLPPELSSVVSTSQLVSYLRARLSDPRGDLESRIDLMLACKGVDAAALSAWVESHAGSSERWMSSDDPQDWDRWRVQLSPTSLREQLEEALGLDTPSEKMTGPELAAAFDLAASIEERRLFHELLTLNLPDGALAPFWPAGRYSVREPDGLAQQWWELLGMAEQSQAFRLRLAGLRWKLGEPVPQVRWEEQLQLREGEQVRFRFEYPLARQDSRGGFGEWIVSMFSPKTAEIEVTLRGKLEHGWGGPGLSWEVPSTGTETSGVRELLRAEATRSRPGAVSCAGLLEERGEGVFQGRFFRSLAQDYELVLALLEPQEASPRAWDVEDWTRRLQANLETQGRGAATSAPWAGTPGSSTARQAEWLARLLFDNETFESLAAGLREPSLNHSQGDAYLQRWFISASDEELRESVASELDLEDSTLVSRANLYRVVQSAGGPLNAEELKLLRRVDREQASDARKALVLQGLFWVVAFLVGGGFFLCLRDLYRQWRSGELVRRLRAVEPEEHIVGSMALFTGALWWIWYGDFHSQTSGPRLASGLYSTAVFLGLGWYALVSFYMGLYLRGGLRLAPAVLWGLALVLGALQGPSDLGRQWLSSPMGWCFILGVLALPLALRELWDWCGDPHRAERLRRRASILYALTILSPLSGELSGGWMTRSSQDRISRARFSGSPC